MLTIVKGYKVGRGVAFYDLEDLMEHKILERVSKEDTVKLINDGKVSNAKVQRWEGNDIVRLQNKNIPILKVEKDGTVAGEAKPIVRSSNTGEAKSNKAEKVEDISSKAEVVGKISKKTKSEIAFAGYDRKNIIEQQQLKSSIKYDSMKTIEDLFNQMAKEFGLKNVDTYKAMFSKKVKMDKLLSEMNQTHVLVVQDAMAVYLMNMANIEIRDTYRKYKATMIA